MGSQGARHVPRLRSGRGLASAAGRRQGGPGGVVQGDQQGVRRWQGRHRDGGQQGEPGAWRDRRRLRLQAAVRHRHGCQGAEDDLAEGRVLRQGGLIQKPTASPRGCRRRSARYNKWYFKLDLHKHEKTKKDVQIFSGKKKKKKKKNFKNLRGKKKKKKKKK